MYSEIMPVGNCTDQVGTRTRRLRLHTSLAPRARPSMLSQGDRERVVKNFWKGHSKITGLVTQLKTSHVSGGGGGCS